MKTIAKATLGALALAAAAFGTAAPANAAVGFSFGFGVPGRSYYPPPRYYGPPPRAYDRCYDSYYGPADCHYPLYSGPVYFGGTWIDGRFPYRDFDGRREFWVHNGWRAAPFGHHDFHGGYRHRR
jgi:hypothetical protein